MSAHRLALEIRGLTLRKDDTGSGEKIFSNLSLDLIDGECFGWLSLGSSAGSAGGHLIDVLCGLRDADQGSVSVFGSPIEKSMDHVKRFIGFLPAEALLDEPLTVHQHLELFTKYFGIDEAHAAEKLVDFEREFHLEGIRDLPCRELSALDKKKVALARALLHTPQILIAHEPFAGLAGPEGGDLKGDDLNRFLKYFALARSKVRTVLVLSSRSEGLESIFDRVALFHDGRLRLLGQPKALMERHMGSHMIRLMVSGAERDYFVSKLSQREIETILLKEEIMIPVKASSRAEIMNEILQGTHFTYRPVILSDLLIYLSMKEPTP